MLSALLKHHYGARTLCVTTREWFILRGWRIGSIGGIAIEINASWLIVFAIIVWDLGTHMFPRLAHSGPQWVPWVWALVTTLLFFSSVLLHELSHSFVARRFGIGVKRITLFVFGGVAQVEEEPRTASEELLISIAGPAMSIMLALVFGAGWWAATQFSGTYLLTAALGRLALVNMILAIFNMVPGFPLDGGRVMRALLWHWWNDVLRATRVASIMGQVVGYSLVALGAYLGAISGSLLLILFYAGMGMLLASMARVTYHRERMKASLRRLSLPPLVVPPELAFPAGTLLSEAAPPLLAYEPRGWVPVLSGAQPIGVLMPAQVRGIPPVQWPAMRVEQVMEPLQEDMVIRHDQPAFEAVERMSATGRPNVLVLDDWGNLQGVVTDGGLRMAMEHQGRG